MEHGVFIAIGSNQGDRVVNCRKAVRQLIEGPGRIGLVKTSSLYETEPWGGVTDQPPFINLVIEVKTAMEPRPLFEFLKSIETGMGRFLSTRWGPRLMDLDIIFYDRITLDDDDLIIPHPFAHERRFVLEPLKEIAPDFVHPVLNKNVAALFKELKDVCWVRKVTTEHL